jgi:hypothetical protein
LRGSVGYLMYYKNIKEFTKQKPEFELKFGFGPGSVRFKKIPKFAEPRTGIKVWFGPLPELWTELLVQFGKVQV